MRSLLFTVGIPKGLARDIAGKDIYTVYILRARGRARHFDLVPICTFSSVGRATDS